MPVAFLKAGVFWPHLAEALRRLAYQLSTVTDVNGENLNAPAIPFHFHESCTFHTSLTYSQDGASRY